MDDSTRQDRQNPMESFAPSQRMGGLQRDDKERASRRAGQHKYTRFVRYMRVLLPLAALVIVMLMILWPRFSSKNFSASSINLDERPTLKKDIQTNRLVTARYEDKDEKGRPYIIEADEAVQQKENPDIIDLKNPKADIKLDAKISLKIKAKSGVFEQEAQNLQLSGGTYFTRSDGATLITQSVYGQMKKGHAQTDDPVSINAPSGTLEAQGGMIVENQGERITFKGPATMVIYAQDRILPQENLGNKGQ